MEGRRGGGPGQSRGGRGEGVHGVWGEDVVELEDEVADGEEDKVEDVVEVEDVVVDGEEDEVVDGEEDEVEEDMVEDVVVDGEEDEVEDKAEEEKT